MYYIAFLAEHVSDFCSDAEDCLFKLVINLTSVMCAKCFAQNVGEAVKPLAMRFLKSTLSGFKRKGKEVPEVSKAEEEFLMAFYDPVHEMIQDYREIAIIFGFVILFTVIFPIGPLLAFLGFYLEVRIDAFKMFEQQRPMPRGAQDVGTW